MNTLTRIVAAVVEAVLPRAPFELWEVHFDLDPDELLADLTCNQS